MIKAYKLYTDATGNSKVVKGYVPDRQHLPAHQLEFKETPSPAAYDWHPAPCLQYVLTLSGQLEFTTSAAQVFLLKPGDVLLAADLTGAGHKWRLLDDTPWRRAYIRLHSLEDAGFIEDQEQDPL
ncbi:hypothetical protein GU926_00305 [Nibribacter ruber]|uniref:AraC-type arabinose-binding/dimerisation domain-containing protein n=1 Tax=Nibribacter ruber TaxID=2698458 RepID=A0A6P1NPY1_9BACT|nr:hypothetical protein [Nibribacter ruber]QHL85966.1 hypothetical protein GU926_00305 [Nibribacter ruber]